MVHQLEHLSFRFICTSFLLSKFATQLKLIQSVVHKFNSQGPALTILVLRVASPKFQGLRYRVLGVRVPCHRFPGPKFLDPSSQGPWSQVLVLDYAIFSYLMASARLDGMKKLNNRSVWKKSIEVHFNRAKIFLLYFYNAYNVSSWEKKFTNVIIEFHFMNLCFGKLTCLQRKIKRKCMQI